MNSNADQGPQLAGLSPMASGSSSVSGAPEVAPMPAPRANIRVGRPSITTGVRARRQEHFC